MEKKEEHIFKNCDKAISKFSPDSKMFAIMIPMYSEELKINESFEFSESDEE